MTYLYIRGCKWCSNSTKLTRIHRLWQCPLIWNWLQASLCLQLFTVLERCILTPLKSQRKSTSVSSTYFRKHSATGNIFFQTLTVNVCHCFMNWCPVHQFRSNLLENLENNQYYTPRNLGNAIHQQRIFFSDTFISWNLKMNNFYI